MKTQPNTGALVGWAFVLILALLAFFLYPREGGDTVTPVSERERARTAESLLAQKLSGPAYFQAAPDDTADTADDTGPWITVGEALRQLPRVAAERKLGPEAKQHLERFIDETTEDPPSRVTGTARINLSRLNLSLDKLPAR